FRKLSLPRIMLNRVGGHGQEVESHVGDWRLPRQTGGIGDIVWLPLRCRIEREERKPLPGPAMPHHQVMPAIWIAEPRVKRSVATLTATVDLQRLAIVFQMKKPIVASLRAFAPVI